MSLKGQMEARVRTHLIGMALNEAGGRKVADWLPGENRTCKIMIYFILYSNTCYGRQLYSFDEATDS